MDKEKDWPPKHKTFLLSTQSGNDFAESRFVVVVVMNQIKNIQHNV